jgi:hypothetical protein
MNIFNFTAKSLLISITLLQLLSCEHFQWNLRKPMIIKDVEALNIDSSSCNISFNLLDNDSKSFNSDAVVYVKLYKDTNTTSVFNVLVNNPQIGINNHYFSNLEINTFYFVQISAINKLGEVKSNFVKFQTLNTSGLATISTLTCDSVTSNTANLRGELINIGNNANFTKGFCYSLNSNPSLSNSSSQVPGNSLGIFKKQISSLNPNSTYYYRAFASNISGVTYGEVFQFHTLNNPNLLPTVSTISSNSITSNSAILVGNIINIGSSSIIEKGFCYSKTTSSPSISNSIINVTSPTLDNFYSTIYNLTPNSIYYYRAYAINSQGVNYGQVNQFQTSVQLQLGQSYQGGVIAYLDQTGIHGLVALQNDLSPSMWGCFQSLIQGADGSCFGCGIQNTNDILNGCGSPGAAFLCYNLSINGYSDWYLPSHSELDWLYQNRIVIGGFNTNTTGSWYWSSTEFDANNAEFINFNNGFDGNYYKNISLNVRPIRKF